MQCTLKSKRKKLRVLQKKDKSQAGVNVNTVNVACTLLQGIWTWDFVFLHM